MQAIYLSILSGTTQGRSQPHNFVWARQEFHFPHFSSNLRLFTCLFSFKPHFCPQFGSPGGRVAPPGPGYATGTAGVYVGHFALRGPPYFLPSSLSPK